MVLIKGAPIRIKGLGLEMLREGLALDPDLGSTFCKGPKKSELLYQSFLLHPL